MQTPYARVWSCKLLLVLVFVIKRGGGEGREGGKEGGIEMKQKESVGEERKDGGRGREGGTEGEGEGGREREREGGRGRGRETSAAARLTRAVIATACPKRA
jgi:hypothetical protein